MVDSRNVILGFIVLLYSLPSYAQIDFGERIESLKDFSSEPVWIETSENFFIAYQTNVKEASRQINLNLLWANQDFSNENVLEVPLRYNHFIRVKKVINDKLYFLAENKDLHLYENYLLSIDLNSKEVEELDIKSAVDGRILNFEVLDNTILLMSYFQKRMVAQVLDKTSNKTYTVEDIYQPGMLLQEVFADELTGKYNLLFNFRKPDRSKSFLLSVIDKEGVVVNNYVMDHNIPNNENIEFLYAGSNALPFIAGTTGITNKVGYNGFYAGFLADGYNPFQNKIDIAELPGFFEFEKDGGEKSMKNWEKARNPTLKDVLAARDLIHNDFGFLLHTDHFLAVGNSHLTKDGVYDHNYYRFNPIKDLNYGRRGTTEPNYVVGTGEFIPRPETDPDIYFSFKSSHFLQFDHNGKVLWDYSIPLPKKSTFVPLSFGQIVSRDKDHFLYVFDGKLFYSQILEGEIQEVNTIFEIPGSQKSEKILKSENYDLELKALNNGSLLLSGRQRLRFVDDSNNAVDQDLFFFQELKVLN